MTTMINLDLTLTLHMRQAGSDYKRWYRARYQFGWQASWMFLGFSWFEVSGRKSMVSCLTLLKAEWIGTLQPSCPAPTLGCWHICCSAPDTLHAPIHTLPYSALPYYVHTGHPIPSGSSYTGALSSIDIQPLLHKTARKCTHNIFHQLM